MSRAYCGFCGADWSDDGKPRCACRTAGERVKKSTTRNALEKFALVLRLGRRIDPATGKVVVDPETGRPICDISPELAADLATGRLAMGDA